jgi:hypothetical protein
VFNPETPDPPFGDWPIFKQPPTPELLKHFMFGLSLVAGIALTTVVAALIWVGSMTLSIP